MLLRLVSDFGFTPSVIFLDGAPENMGVDMKGMLRQFGCRPAYSAPHLGDNNIAERFIGIITAGAKALLIHSGLGLKFW